MLENLLGLYLGHNFVVIVVQVLALLDIRHCSKLQSCAISKKTNKPNLRKCLKKLISALILVRVVQIWVPKLFSWVLLQLDVRHCHGLWSYAISRKNYDLNSRKWQKTSFWTDLSPLGPNPVSSPFFFWKVWLRKSVDIMVSYHRVQYQENLTIQSWKKLVIDGQMGGRTDGQTDKRTRMIS